MESGVEYKRLGLELTFKVSKYGSGWYMRIPTDLARALGVVPGDRLVLTVKKLVRTKKQGRRRRT